MVCVFVLAALDRRDPRIRFWPDDRDSSGALPGFLDYLAAYTKERPREPEFLWLRFLEWTDEKLFHVSMAEGWRHALGSYHSGVFRHGCSIRTFDSSRKCRLEG